MVVGVLRIWLVIEGNHSLKGKRSVIRHVQETIRNRFGATVAEVADQDLWQSAEIGVALVGSDHKRLNASLDRILNHVENLHIAELRDHEMEIIHLGERERR
jgi:uncharacterized protein YlxP (DUF503 family)